MNKRIFSVVITAIMVLSALTTLVNAEDNATIEIRSLTTDKDVYHLGEDMEIFLSVYSPGNVSNVLIEVSGLKGRHGTNLISFSREIGLRSGENKMNFSYKIPSCGCAVSYGSHFINASVYNEEVVNATHSIVLTSQGQIAYVNIMVEEAKRMIESEDVTLLDVRTNEEYDSAHINGAILIPVSELADRINELNKSEKIVVYCKSGNRSATASGMLIEHGFKNVYNVLGGIIAWKDKGYEVVTTQEQPGFEAVFAIAALLAIAYYMRDKK